MFKKKNLIVTVFSLLLLAFTVYVISDTFLITRVYSSAEAGTTEGSGNGSEPVSAAGSSEEEQNGSETAASEEASKEPGSGRGIAAVADKQPGSGSSAQPSDTTRSGPPSRHRTKQSSVNSDESTETPSANGSSSGQAASSSSGNSSSGAAVNSSAGGSSSGQTTNPSAGSSSSAGATSTATQYQDDHLSINLTEYQVSGTTVYVADVQTDSPQYLKTALAQNAYGKNVTDETSDIAAGVNAILAINGDYYGSRENGYVLRNGVLYRNTPKNGQEDLVIYEDGSFEIITETEISAEELLAKGAVQILSFGPGLVENGTTSVSVNDEVGKAKSSNPRTAIGIIDENHYVFVVSDGRTSESEGLSLYELAEFMQTLGVSTAYNLDGGGSSTLYYNGQVINNPTTNGNSIKERKVSDIVYIGY